MSPAEYQDAARVKRGFNQPLNLRELAAAYGLKYHRARQYSLASDFPMVRGLVFPAAFEAWMAAGPRSHSAAGLPRNGADRARGPGSTNGSRVSWQRLAQSLPALGLSLG